MRIWGMFLLLVGCARGPDADGDGARASDDCDDTNPAVHPEAVERCGGADEDCDARLDDADDNLDPATTPVWYQDVDGDGYGSSANVLRACAPPAGYVDRGEDCDDTPTGANRNPGAQEVCDGIDNNCDIATGVLVDDADPTVDLSTQRYWYVDNDRDGQGDPLTAVLSCSPPNNGVENGEDCDDRDASNFQGNTESCDGRDNNCDGLVDSADWWDAAWPYRVLVRATAPTTDTHGPPISVDVDFAAALAALGDNSGLDLDSVRVVVQDCVGGYVEVAHTFADGLERVFDDRSMFSVAGDARGALLFRYDLDGDYDTAELLGAGETVNIGVYFGSNAASPGVPAPAWATSLTAGVAGAAGSRTVTFESGVSTTILDESQGGAVDAMSLYGQPPGIGAQTGNIFGNGIFFGVAGGGGGSWASVVQQPATAFGLVVDSPTVAMARSVTAASNAYGGFASTTWTWQFAGRPELYAKVVYTLNQDSHVGPQGTYWTAAVRPWQVDNRLLVDGASGASKDDPGFRWVHGDYPGTADGVFIGWRTPSDTIGSPFFTLDGRYLALSGQDVTRNPGGAETDLADGTVVLNGATVIVYPHTGDMNIALDEFLGLATGVTAVALPAEEVP